MQGPATVILIPTYNERDCLRQIVPAVRAAAPEADVLIVDDNSPDGTGQLADEIAAADPRVQVLHRAHKQGLGAAYLAAFHFALDSERSWKRIVQMDADFSHNPADVPRLLAALDAGADLAIGSRYVDGGGTENWGLARRLISRGGGTYARSVLGIDIQDLTAGFKAWNATTLRGIDLNAVAARGYGFQIEMTFRALRNGFRVVEVPIKFIDRRVGQSKMSGTIFFEALTLVWSLRARIPPSRG
ncbi:MAG: dolichyl-phosphate beta-D-mannosyltransferase [Myxococcales bacterium]|nr:dolichyl-phosphate beta-D-mannosyltransferase [Myxococcales bacterium]